MLIVEHRLKTLENSHVMTVEVAGPAPATHLFLCSGRVHIEASRTVERTGLVNIVEPTPLPFSLILPDSHRQYFSLMSSDGTPLRILSSQASASFPIIDVGDYTRPRRKEIRAAEIHQQDTHAVLLIYLQVDTTDVEITMQYQASILAGPAR